MFKIIEIYLKHLVHETLDLVHLVHETQVWRREIFLFFLMLLHISSFKT